MQRPIIQWVNCNPETMAFTLSPAALMYALQDARADIMALHSLAQRVANLNPDAGEIGAGMLADLVATARRITQ